MKISTKGRYGARAMISLAAKYGEKQPMSAFEIAEQQGISQKYLESILSILKSAGLISVRRGASGGYMLNHPPKEVTFFDILTPLEDSLNFVHCTDDDSICERFDQCVTRLVWQELKDASEKILKKKTLADMLKEKQRASK